MLQDWLDIEVRSWFAGRIFPVTEAIAERWGQLAAAARQRAADLGVVVDGVIAATALHHDLTLVTRNVKDDDSVGSTTSNPWEYIRCAASATLLQSGRSGSTASLPSIMIDAVHIHAIM